MKERNLAGEFCIVDRKFSNLQCLMNTLTAYFLKSPKCLKLHLVTPPLYQLTLNAGTPDQSGEWLKLGIVIGFSCANK